MKKHIKRVIKKHAKVRRKTLVKCKSCRGPAHKVEDFCYGCKRVICLRCMTKYDHNGSGAKHGVKPKKKVRKASRHAAELAHAFAWGEDRHWS